jgi:hypothetical protein
MAPIANPEDLPPEARARIYGHRYDHLDGARTRLAADAALRPVRHDTRRLRRRERAPDVAAGPAPTTSPAAASSNAAATADDSVAASGTAAGGAPNSIDTNALSIPSAPMLDVPMVGRVPSKVLVATALLLLAAALMALAVRGLPRRGDTDKTQEDYRSTQLGETRAAPPRVPRASGSSRRAS